MPNKLYVPVKQSSDHWCRLHKQSWSFLFYRVQKQRAVAWKKTKTCFFGIISLEKKRPKSSLWFCTWEEYKDFGCFVVLPPAVCIFTVQRVTGVLACVGTGAVDHSQDAKPLLLDHPGWTTEATGLRISNLHAFKQKHSFEVADISVSINCPQH